jgi:hypothetical protein
MIRDIKVRGWNELQKGGIAVSGARKLWRLIGCGSFGGAMGTSELELSDWPVWIAKSGVRAIYRRIL